MKPRHVLNMFLTFWYLKPYVLMRFGVIKKRVEYIDVSSQSDIFIKIHSNVIQFVKKHFEIATMNKCQLNLKNND